MGAPTVHDWQEGLSTYQAAFLDSHGFTKSQFLQNLLQLRRKESCVGVKKIQDFLTSTAIPMKWNAKIESLNAEGDSVTGYFLGTDNAALKMGAEMKLVATVHDGKITHLQWTGNK